MRGVATAFDFNHMARLKPRTARNRRERRPLGIRTALGHLVVTGIAILRQRFRIVMGRRHHCDYMFGAGAVGEHRNPASQENHAQKPSASDSHYRNRMGRICREEEIANASRERPC
jgi:hypothetical protein